MGDAQNELGLLPKFNDLCEIAVSDILSDQYSAHCRETQRIKIDVTNFLIQFCCVSCCLEALTFNTQKNHKESSQPSEIFQNEMVKRAFEFDNTKKRYKIDISNLIEPELSKFHTNKENIPRIFSKHRFWQTMNPLEHLWSVNTIQKLTSFLEENISADAISAIFENTHLSHTKGEATQGVYYTPTAEIKSTILFACYYYLIKKIQDHNNDVFKLLFRILYDIDAPH